MAIAALVLVVLVAAFLMLRPSSERSGAGHSATAFELRVGTFSKALGNAPLYIAIEHGWFEQHPALRGVRVTYTEYNDRPAIAAAFSRDNLDLLFSAEIPAILIRAQGEEVTFGLASTYALQEVLVPTDSLVSRIADLRGRRVAVQAGTSSHFGLVQILQAAGLSAADVRISYMPAAEARAAFESGQLDAWAVWAPWVETQQVSGRGRVLQGSEARIYSVATFRSGFVSAHPAEANAIIEVLQRAKRWCQDHPEEAARIVSQSLGFDLPAVRLAWPKFHWTAQLDDAARDEFQRKADFLAEQSLTRNNRVVDMAREMFR